MDMNNIEQGSGKKSKNKPQKEEADKYTKVVKGIAKILNPPQAMTLLILVLVVLLVSCSMLWWGVLEPGTINNHFIPSVGATEIVIADNNIEIRNLSKPASFNFFIECKIANQKAVFGKNYWVENDTIIPLYDIFETGDLINETTPDMASLCSETLLKAKLNSEIFQLGQVKDMNSILFTFDFFIQDGQIYTNITRYSVLREVMYTIKPKA